MSHEDEGSLNLDLFEKKHTHSNGFKTEAQAAKKVAASVASMRSRILADLAAFEVGITPDEWSYQNAALINTVRRRFTDLWKDGLIRHHPESRTKKNLAGNDCVVWVLGIDPLLEKESFCECCGQKIRRQERMAA